MGICALKPEGLWVSLHCPVKAGRVGASPVVTSRDLVQESWPCFQAGSVCSVEGEDRQKVLVCTAGKIPGPRGIHVLCSEGPLVLQVKDEGVGVARSQESEGWVLWKINPSVRGWSGCTVWGISAPVEGEIIQGEPD